MESLLDLYRQLPFFGDEPLHKSIDGLCRLSDDQELDELVSSEAKYLILYTIRPIHHFYVIEKIEVKNTK